MLNFHDNRIETWIPASKYDELWPTTFIFPFYLHHLPVLKSTVEKHLYVAETSGSLVHNNKFCEMDIEINFLI